jgi:hypothetical protein
VSKRSAPVVLLLALLACDSSPTAPGHTEQVAIATVLSASSSGIEVARDEVIRDGATWASVWSELHSRQSPVPPLPSVDFGQHMLLLTALGTRSNGCYSVAIASVARGGGRLLASVEETAPGTACGCTAALVQPVHVVRAPRRAEPVEFRTRRTALRCSGE